MLAVRDDGGGRGGRDDRGRGGRGERERLAVLAAGATAGRRDGGERAGE